MLSSRPPICQRTSGTENYSGKTFKNSFSSLYLSTKTLKGKTVHTFQYKKGLHWHISVSVIKSSFNAPFRLIVAHFYKEYIYQTLQPLHWFNFKDQFLLPPKELLGQSKERESCSPVILYIWLEATPLEASSGTLNVWFRISIMSMLCSSLHENFKHFRFFVISLGRVVAPYPKIVINLSGTYEKLPC